MVANMWKEIKMIICVSVLMYMDELKWISNIFSSSIPVGLYPLV